MRVVVTGATGLLGNNVVRAALEQGHEVVAVARTAEGATSLAGLSVTPVNADVTQWSSLDGGCLGRLDAVIHCAAHIHLGWSQRAEGMRINVEGTRNALRLAEERGGRCIHVSTVDTLAVGSKDQPADESTPREGQIPCTYVVTKQAAEAQAQHAIERGSNVVIVHPGFMLGPWDWKPSSGRMILDLRRGAPPLAPSGGCSICDPRDVADAILTAVSRAARGAHYILGGENWTYFQLWNEIAARLHRRPPRMTLQPGMQWVIGRVGDCCAKLTGREPILNSAAVAMSAQYHWYSSQRAIDELDYRPRPASQSLDDAIAWFHEHGMLS